MVVKWTPGWHELDQTIVVGDVDLFYLSKDKCFFDNGFRGKDGHEIKAEIIGITHPELGDVQGIIAIGLCYTIYISDGNEIIVEAEECPGCIEGCKYAVRQVSGWNFDVQIKIIEETDLSSAKSGHMLTPAERKMRKQERIKKYKYLLDLSEALWAR